MGLLSLAAVAVKSVTSLEIAAVIAETVQDVISSKKKINESQSFYKDPIEELKELKRLVYEGFITESEYQEKRKECLKRL